MSEIALNVPPDGVHVVGAVLCVVVLHQERAALDPIVMWPVPPLFAAVFVFGIFTVLLPLASNLVELSIIRFVGALGIGGGDGYDAVHQWRTAACDLSPKASAHPNHHTSAAA